MRLLDGIPNTYVHPIETNFLSALNDLTSKGRLLKRTIQNATIKPLLHLDNFIQTSLLIKRYKCQEEEMQSDYIAQLSEILCGLGRAPFTILEAKPAYLPKDFINDFLEAMSKWINNGSHVENIFFKTVETPYIEDYEKTFPEMKFIHIIRNPIDMYSSQKRTLMCYKALPSWYLGGDNLETVIDRRWIPHVKSILNNCPSKKHFLIRYEDLVNDPLGKIKGVCDWLGVSLPSHPSKQTILGGKFAKQLPNNLSKKGAETPVNVISNLAKRLSYEKVLTGREQALITYKTYPYALKLGYFQDISMPEIVNIAPKWILPDKWEFIHSKTFIGLVRSTWSCFERRYKILRGILE